MAVFYEVPASELVAGVSTDDGQDVLGTVAIGDNIQVEVYTPRLDDAMEDLQNRGRSDTRVYASTRYIGLAVFDHTAVDLSQHPAARNRRTA